MFHEITFLDWIEVALCCVLGITITFGFLDEWLPVRIVVAVVSFIALGVVIAAQVRRDLRGHGRRSQR